MCRDCKCQKKCEKKPLTLVGNGIWNFGEEQVTIPILITLHGDGTVSFVDSPSLAVPGFPAGLLGTSGQGRWKKRCGKLEITFVNFSNQKVVEVPGTPAVPFIKCLYKFELVKSGEQWLGDFVVTLHAPQTDLPFGPVVNTLTGSFTFVKFPFDL